MRAAYHKPLLLERGWGKFIEDFEVYTVVRSNESLHEVCLGMVS